MMLGDPGVLGDCPPERSTYVGLPRLTAMQLRCDASHWMATDWARGTRVQEDMDGLYECDPGRDTARPGRKRKGKDQLGAV